MYLEPFRIPSADITARMTGKHNGELVRDLFGPGLTDAEVKRHGAAKEALYRELMAPQIERRLVAGLREFLDAHDGVKKGIASNAEPANVRFVLDGTGLRQYFDAVVDGHMIERPKPHPEVYLRAADLLGAEPAQCVVFEDSATGIEAGRRAGMRVVGVRTTEAALEGVDLSIGDFRDPELERWLSGLGG